MTLLEFECQGHRFAFPLACVRRIILSVKPRPLPGAPQIVLGMLNIADEVVTVVDFCWRTGLPKTAIVTSQRIVLIDVTGFHLGVIVDEVHGVVCRELDVIDPVPERFAGADFINSIVRLDDGLCVIVDPENFLFDDERAALVDALEIHGHE